MLKVNFYFLFKRITDILLSIIFIIISLLPVLIILMIFFLTQKGSFIHWSKRIGKENIYFNMPKIRTMKLNTPDIATHLLNDNHLYVTKFGNFLRKTSLDEIPQLYSVLTGHMSFVGPRPALFNQIDLKDLRTKNNIHNIKPGITGWAQIMGRDNLSIEEKVKYDLEYYNNKSILFDIKIILITVLKIFKMKDVSH